LVRGKKNPPPPTSQFPPSPRKVYLDAQKILADFWYLPYLTYPQGSEG
jgi:hypothetical protein